MSIRFAVVGSRNTPTDVLELMVRVGRTLTDLGYHLSSGDAYGADRAFYCGAIQSKRYQLGMFKAYIIYNGFLGRYSDNITFINFSSFNTSIRAKACELGIEARGSEYGLTPVSRLLFARNAMQVLGDNLDRPVDGIIFHAKPSKSKPDRVTGGTNAALQLALKNNVKLIFNLAVPKDRLRIESWLERNEKDYAYLDLIWEDIIDPNKLT